MNNGRITDKVTPLYLSTFLCYIPGADQRGITGIVEIRRPQGNRGGEKGRTKQHGDHPVTRSDPVLLSATVGGRVMLGIRPDKSRSSVGNRSGSGSLRSGLLSRLYDCCRGHGRGGTLALGDVDVPLHVFGLAVRESKHDLSAAHRAQTAETSRVCVTESGRAGGKTTGALPEHVHPLAAAAAVVRAAPREWLANTGLTESSEALIVPQEEHGPVQPAAAHGTRGRVHKDPVGVYVQEAALGQGLLHRAQTAHAVQALELFLVHLRTVHQRARLAHRVPAVVLARRIS